MANSSYPNRMAIFLSTAIFSRRHFCHLRRWLLSCCLPFDWVLVIWLFHHYHLDHLHYHCSSQAILPTNHQLVIDKDAGSVVVLRLVMLWNIFQFVMVLCYFVFRFRRCQYWLQQSWKWNREIIMITFATIIISKRVGDSFLDFLFHRK